MIAEEKMHHFFLIESSLLLKQISSRKYSPPAPVGSYCRFLQHGSLLCTAHHSSSRSFPIPGGSGRAAVRDPAPVAVRTPRRARLPLPQRGRCLPPAGGLVCAAGPAASPVFGRDYLPTGRVFERCLPRSSCGRGRSRAPLC